LLTAGAQDHRQAGGRTQGDPVLEPGQPVEGIRARLSVIRPLIRRKYRADMVIFRPLWFVQAKLHLGPRETKPVILAITPG